MGIEASLQISSKVAFEGLREGDHDEAKYQAWAHGQTGYLFIDMCMRNLIRDGWITFCMCAMLVSFASYQIWLDWRITGKHLTRLFTDFGSRFHYSQLQMQSGDTGINAMPVYNIIKQLSMIQMVTILESGCQSSVDSRFNKNKTLF